MTPTRLRSWMQKYGNIGVLMVAGYFGLRYLWQERVRLALASLCLLCLTFALVQTRRSRHRAIVTPPMVVAAPIPPEEEARDYTKDHIESTEEIQDGNDLWRVEIWWPKRGLEVGEFARFYKNGTLIRTVNAHELDGDGLQFGKAGFKTRYPLIVLAALPGMGHVRDSALFAIRNGVLVKMMQIDGMHAGPVFRDYDGDGRPEWVFDDYNWYRYREEGPMKYLVYKEQKDGTLKLWKRLPNRKRLRLPDRLGRGLE